MTFNNSHIDKLQLQFEKVRVEIRKQNKEFREVAIIDKNNILRTVAITIFSPFEFNNLKFHEDIINGEAISISLKYHGVNYSKIVRNSFEVRLTESLKKQFLTNSNYTKSEFSELFINENGKDILYAEICEIFHPEFKNEKTVINSYYKHKKLKIMLEQLNLKVI